MQWWNDILAALSSDDGVRLLTTAVVPFAAILAAGLLAAWIARGSTRRLLARHDREVSASAVAALLGAARRAAMWSSLGTEERMRVDMLGADAETRLRLLPVRGSGLAADWAVHQLEEMKRSSASITSSSEPRLEELRDRLVRWHQRPASARRLFRDDLERWQREPEQAGGSATDDNYGILTRDDPPPFPVTARMQTLPDSDR